MLATAIGFYPTAIERLATSFIVPLHERGVIRFEPAWENLAFFFASGRITKHYSNRLVAACVLVFPSLPSHRPEVADLLPVIGLNHVLAAKQLPH
jgi:hypothetical protein